MVRESVTRRLTTTFCAVFEVVGLEGETAWRKVMHLLTEDTFVGE